MDRFFRISEEEPLAPIEEAVKECIAEHRAMYESIKGVGCIPKTNSVARHLELVENLQNEVLEQ